jgi:hypothetical protein
MTEYPSLEFDFGGTVDTKEQYEQIVALGESAEVLAAVKIAPRAQAPSASQQPTVVETAPAPAVEEVPAPVPAEEAPAKSLSDLLGTKPKAAPKKKAEKPVEPTPEPVVAVEAAPATPVAEEGGEITSLDQLLSKLKK